MKTPSRPVDPFTGAKPRPAESVKAHETTPQELAANRADAIAQRAAEQKQAAARRGPRGAPAPERAPAAPAWARALELCRGGMSAPDAAREVGVSLSTVKGWCVAAGVELTPGKPGPKAREGRSRTVEFQYGGRKFAAVLQGAELVLREMRRGGPETVESGRVVGKEIQMRRPLSPDLHEAMRGAIFGATPTPTPSTTKTAIVTGTAQAPGRLAVGNEVVEIRPGDTGEQITQRVAEARAKAAAVPPTMEAAAADLGVELTPGVRAFGKMFEAAARREPLAPALPEGVELPPVAVTVKPQLPAHAFEWKAPEITPAPVVEAPAPANPEITPAAAARFAETAGAIDPPRRTARGGQLEAPEVPAPRHVEVYVGPPRAARVEVLEAERAAALKVLRDQGSTTSDRVRLAAAILAGGAS